MFRGLLSVVAVLAAIGLAYGVKSVFAISDSAFNWTLFVIAATWVGYLVSRRLDALEERVLHQDFQKIIQLIEEGERHAPRHDPPLSLEAGGAYESFIKPPHVVLFNDFRWYGSMLNHHLADSWSVEELNDTDVRDPLSDGPKVGRRYRVWYNACELGTIQVTVGGIDWIFNPEHFESNRCASVLIDLNYLRFVPYQDAHNFVSTIALLTFQDRKDARNLASAEATAALASYLWESVRCPEIAVAFEHRLEGPYDLLREVTDGWELDGIDPFERWGGDRPA